MVLKDLPEPQSFIELHGKKYQIPQKPVVVVCVDGFDPEYLDQSITAGILPIMASFVNSGFHTTAKSVMPSVTNPNNVSIITGVPTSIHGIATNCFLDRETREEKIITDDSLLQGSTILEQLSAKGVRVAAITAKDKLRKIINHGLSPVNKSVCFSAEYVKECTLAEHGISDVENWLGKLAPPRYSGDLSLFVLDAGIKLLQEHRADVMYLTLSDFVQHRFAPGSTEADNFMAALDCRLEKFVELGALVAVTGDHGISDKTDSNGSINVLYLEDVLNQKWGDGFARVICPITDQLLRHHGGLGSFVRVYLDENIAGPKRVVEFCRSLSQVEIALEGSEAAQLFEMPADREGDVVVVAKKNAVIGSREDEHDLSNLEGHKLRSHGGLSEQEIPLLRSLPLEKQGADSKSWRNFDIFDLALNW